MSRFRKFSTVIHNVKPDEQSYWSAACVGLRAERVVSAIEEYPESPGHYHIHVFIQTKDARSIISIVKFFDKVKSGHILEAPDKSKTPGRVQVDPMRGSFDEATDYLTAGKSSKDKNFGVVKDENPSHGICELCGTCQHKAIMYDILCIRCFGAYRDHPEPHPTIAAWFSHPTMSEWIQCVKACKK